MVDRNFAGNQPADANRVWRVARYPEVGETVGRQHFRASREALPIPADGEFLVRTICLATGPAQRGYLQSSHGGFLDPISLDGVMRGRGVGQIVDSRHPDYPAGEIFVGSLGWQDYSLQRPRGADFVYSAKIVPNPVRPLSTALGILGNTGVTAYFGLLDVGRMRPGDAVLVSAAAGGVGSVVGQIARIRGAGSIVGVAGTPEKCAWIQDTLGYDHAIDYRQDNLQDRLGELFSDGIDVFFDNVGGEILNTALAHLAIGARVAICGFIATEYEPGPQRGPTNYRELVYRRARMQGFVVFDYWDRYAEAEADLSRWYHDGRLVNCEDVVDGLDNMPDALESLFTGGNRGIRICRVAPDPERLPPD